MIANSKNAAKILYLHQLFSWKYKKGVIKLKILQKKIDLKWVTLIDLCNALFLLGLTFIQIHWLISSNPIIMLVFLVRKLSFLMKDSPNKPNYFISLQHWAHFIYFKNRINRITKRYNQRKNKKMLSSMKNNLHLKESL